MKFSPGFQFVKLRSAGARFCCLFNSARHSRSSSEVLGSSSSLGRPSGSCKARPILQLRNGKAVVGNKNRFRDQRTSLGTICPNLSSILFVVALVHNSGCTVWTCPHSPFLHEKNASFLTTKENCSSLTVAANFFHFFIFQIFFVLGLKTLHRYTF